MRRRSRRHTRGTTNDADEEDEGRRKVRYACCLILRTRWVSSQMFTFFVDGSPRRKKKKVKTNKMSASESSRSEGAIIKIRQDECNIR